MQINNQTKKWRISGTSTKQEHDCLAGRTNPKIKTDIINKQGNKQRNKQYKQSNKWRIPGTKTKQEHECLAGRTSTSPSNMKREK